MADMINQLWGGCACDRNQYEILIPTNNARLASVYFDNSSLSRRTQASPVTAWLRVPLDWYQSVTVAHFPDETHSSIKRTFHTPSSIPALSSRRQFCGYCGSHLTQWAEPLSRSIDVTLGSLLSESLQKLESLNILPDLESEGEPRASAQEGLMQGASLNEEDHIPTNEDSIGGVDHRNAPRRQPETTASHLMQGRGMPYFEDLVENSRLGRIKRQVGGHTSRDGTLSVSWEVIEIGDSPEPEVMTGVSQTNPSNKRQKIGQ